MHLAALGDTAETLQGAWHATHKQDLRPTAAPEAMEPPGVGDQQALILGQELENRRGHRGPGMKTPVWLAMTDRIRRQPKHDGTLVFPRACGLTFLSRHCPQQTGISDEALPASEEALGPCHQQPSSLCSPEPGGRMDNPP